MGKKQSGFTLIEILVVILILGILGFIFSDILTQVLRGQNKVGTVAKIKETGQLVLDTLSGEIRNGEEVICVDKSGSSIYKDTLVVFKRGIYSQFRLSTPADENGRITRDDFSADDVPDGVISDSQLCTSTVPFGSVGTLTNTDPMSGSLVPDGISDVFSQNTKPGFSDTITVKFRILPGVQGGNTPEADMGADGVLFTTTAQVKGGK